MITRKRYDSHFNCALGYASNLPKAELPTEYNGVKSDYAYFKRFHRACRPKKCQILDCKCSRLVI